MWDVFRLYVHFNAKQTRQSSGIRQVLHRLALKQRHKVQLCKILCLIHFSWTTGLYHVIIDTTVIYFPQDEDVFNERMRVNNESSSEIQSEAVVLKDLTKVCCTGNLRWMIAFITYKQVSGILFPCKLQVYLKWQSQVSLP